MHLLIPQIATYIRAANFGRLILRIMKVLGWETQREAVMGILYILGIIAIVIFVLKVIILFLKNSGNENILENGENKDDDSNEGSDENNNDKLFFE